MLPLTPLNIGAPGESAPSLLGQNSSISRTAGVSTPTMRQTGFGVTAPNVMNAAHHYTPDHPRVQIYHPSQAPSGQTTENALMAKALMSQPYAHSGAATKIARISNMFLDAPRFGSAVNLIS